MGDTAAMGDSPTGTGDTAAKEDTSATGMLPLWEHCCHKDAATMGMLLPRGSCCYGDTAAREDITATGDTTAVAMLPPQGTPPP